MFFFSLVFEVRYKSAFLKNNFPVVFDISIVIRQKKRSVLQTIISNIIYKYLFTLGRVSMLIVISSGLQFLHVMHTLIVN